MNKRHYEHTLPNIRGSLSNTYFLPVSYDGHCLFPMVIEGIRGIIVKLGDDYML